jgi:hypothetical protein
LREEECKGGERKETDEGRGGRELLPSTRTLKLGSRVRLFQKKGTLAATVVAEGAENVIGWLYPSSSADWKH